MNWKKAIGFGILIWLIMFAVVSALLGWYGFLWLRIAVAVVGGIISFILAGYVKPKSAVSALSYGLIWVVAGIILDALITMRFNSAIFSSKTLWLGYFFILLAPLLRVKKT
ncbi:MAG: hypothetical protein WC610_02605 [Patescibacteria group bacterium]